jgi:hypothetical protein
MEMKKLTGMIVLLAMAGSAMAATTVDVYRLGVNEMASHLGANLMIEVGYEDFTESDTNTAEVLTLDIAAGEGFALLYADVIEEFVGALGTDSLTVTVGNTDVDQYLASMELATESSEVSGKFGTGIDGANGEFYETADTIDFTFTPNAENATDDFTAGRVRFYCILIE